VTDTAVTPEPAAPATPAAPPPLASLPDGGQRLVSPRDAAIAAVLAKRVAQAKASEAAPAAPAADAAPLAEPPKAEPPKSERTPLDEARLQREMIERDRKIYEATQRAKDLEAKLKKRDEDEARRKANPVEALKDYGYTYEDLTKGIVEGKFAPQSPEQLAIEANKSEVQQLREQLDALMAEKQQTTQQMQMQARAQEIESVLKREDVAEKIPFLSSMPWAARHMAEWVEKNPQGDADAYAIELDQHLARENSTTFTSDRVLKRLLADEATKTRVMALLGITKQAEPPAQQAATGTSKGNGPSAIPSSAASDPGTRKTPSRAVTEAERKANAYKTVMAKRQAV
jgi:hypothetical protein